MAVAVLDGPASARPRVAMGGGPQNAISQNFVKLVERTTDALVGSDYTRVEDARRILKQVREQYDSVHYEAEQKEAALRKVRELIRSADLLHGQQAEETHRLDDNCVGLRQQYTDTMKRITETQTARKVYEHMLSRIQKEQAILKQKMLKMEDHLERKRREVQQKKCEHERIQAQRVAGLRNLEVLSEDAETERSACSNARKVMEGELERRRGANKVRADFESWRHEVALEAANEAFNATAGKLRKLYAIEKLAGNSLQKYTIEQVERAQNTEDGFQKIREVTGLADVMDIVHKFLNREVEHEQLKGSVKDAEVRLDILRQDYETFKRDTEGITFDKSMSGPGGVYKDFEQAERTLNEVMEEHEVARMRLQKTNLQSEHMKRWAARVGQLLSAFEEPVKVEGPVDMKGFFQRLQVAVEKFISRVSQQIHDGKVTRKVLVQGMTKEFKEQEQILKNGEFLKLNVRVNVGDAVGRSTSRQGSAEDDPTNSFSEDRERCKKESEDVTRTALIEETRKKQQKEQGQKKGGGRT